MVDSIAISNTMDQPSNANASEENDEENYIEEIDDQDSDYYFETDHVALKGNKDYHALLRTICVLEAQRMKGLKDIDTLLGYKKQLNENPMEFMDLLINNKIEMPKPQVLATLPNIDWSQFNIPIPELESVLQNVEKATQKEDKDLDRGIFVRGRMFTNDKPQSFNQLWSYEEQKRLDELLIKYPIEPIETNRWRKIAADLGSRTPKQVCSRVQKYFLKLQKAGMPIPGRAPKALHSDSLKRSSHPHQKINRFPFRSSTFFPSHDVPVDMSETEYDSPVMGPSSFNNDQKPESVDGTTAYFLDSKVPEEMKCMYGTRNVQVLQEVLEIKESGDYDHLTHSGTKCNFCNESPILGVRWHCMQCETIPVDYCSDCMVSQMESNNPHPTSHSIVPIKEVQSTSNGIYDPDYLPSSFALPGSSYNYLDPNFMPV